MIETVYHTIPANIYKEVESQAKELGVSVDYFLMEFCTISNEEAKQS